MSSTAPKKQPRTAPKPKVLALTKPPPKSAAELEVEREIKQRREFEATYDAPDFLDPFHLKLGRRYVTDGTGRDEIKAALAIFAAAFVSWEDVDVSHFTAQFVEVMHEINQEGGDEWIEIMHSPNLATTERTRRLDETIASVLEKSRRVQQPAPTAGKGVTK